jgi:hypothetical protein
LLDPYGVDELCGDFLDESGFHNSGTPTIGVEPREPTAGRDDPAFTAWSELLAAVGATDPADAKAVTTLVPRMTAWFRTAPFRPADIIASLYALDGKRGAVLLEGLSGAARIEAEEVLRQVAGSQTVNVLARKAAVRALARRPWSSRSAEALYQLAETGQRDLSHAAWLALGTAANRLSMTAEADRIRERLIQAFTRATAAADRKILIAALGNTGADAALSVIEPAIAHPDPGVRAVAVSALRLVASSRADTLIRDRLTKDPDLSVRKWALMATAYRDPRLHRDAVKSIVESHPAEELRGRAVRLATDWSHAGMDVRDILAAAGR